MEKKKKKLAGAPWTAESPLDLEPWAGAQPAPVQGRHWLLALADF